MSNIMEKIRFTKLYEIKQLMDELYIEEEQICSFYRGVTGMSIEKLEDIPAKYGDSILKYLNKVEHREDYELRR